ncbi:MAG: ABC transporter ATP-binding protein [Actinomycetota bacterium]
MARIVLDGVTKTFPDGTHAVRELDLDIQDGELMVLVGPSGCGKTTALRMVAGLEEITSGTISIDGRRVNDVEPRERDVAMVFQSYALYPHLTVYENMAFSLRYRKTAKAEIDRRVRDVARVLEVDALLDRRPRQLSGGQRQRVAMGRAIVRQPKAFLMDEPLSNLDAQLRVQMRSEIARLQHELGVTTIYVTHDQTEGMTLGDRVAVLSHGVLQQLATPRELYARPVNLFVAGFIGSPGMNLVEARLRRDGERWDIDFGGHHVRVPAASLGDRPALAGFQDRPVIVGVRPENIEDAAFVQHVDPEAMLDVEVALREELGSEVDVLFRPGAAPVVATPVAVGDEADVGATIRSSTMIARLDPRSKATEGERIRLQVDTGTLQFFDPESGQRIEG